MNQEMAIYDKDINQFNTKYENKTDLVQKQETRFRSMKQNFAASQQNRDKVLNSWNDQRNKWTLQGKEKEEKNKELLQDIADMTGKVRDKTDILDKMKEEQTTITAKLTSLKHKFQTSYVFISNFCYFSGI